MPRRFIRPLIRFSQIESASGIALLIAAAAALVWANLPGGESYEEFWATPIELSLGPVHFAETLRHAVNDGLMTIFFFLVGLEIKREIVSGDLGNPKSAALPVIAAMGGMIVPAVLYLMIAGGIEGASRGWGVPMATDIAFSLGVVALLGTRVPVGGKLFLLALAVADDIGAITVIAVFYTEELALPYLAATIGLLAICFMANRIGIRSFAFYVPVGMLAWLFLFESGVHATLAGVALGFLTPARAMYSDDAYRQRAVRILDAHAAEAAAPEGEERIDFRAIEMSEVSRESVPPLHRIESKLLPWSSFIVVPLFALANAGVRFAGVDLLEAATHPVALGVGVGLFVGKVVGISLFAWMAVRLGIAQLPRLTQWRHIIGLAAVAGIGFTVALFVADLAFASRELLDLAKTGIFLGSTVAGMVGYLVLRTIAHIPHRSGSHSRDGGNVASR